MKWQAVMEGTKEAPAENLTRKARGRFFLRVGQAGRGRWRDENTLPLFPLPLIMDCEGLLSRAAKQSLVEGAR